MSATVGALAAVGGGLGALAWEPLEPWLIARSEGAEELLEQPPWTRTVTSRPVLMLVSAIACGAAGLRFGATRELIPALVLAFALVGISAIDLRYRIIPDRISLPLAVAGLALAAVLRPFRSAGAADRGLRRGCVPALRGAALAQRAWAWATSSSCSCWGCSRGAPS